MKKIIVILILSSFFTTHLFASERITELQTEAQKLIQEINQMNQEIQSRQVRVIEIQGALKELSKTEKNDKEGLNV